MRAVLGLRPPTERRSHARSRGLPASGSPRTMNPSATRESMYRACSSQPSCSRSSTTNPTGRHARAGQRRTPLNVTSSSSGPRTPALWPGARTRSKQAQGEVLHGDDGLASGVPGFEVSDRLSRLVQRVSCGRSPAQLQNVGRAIFGVDDRFHGAPRSARVRWKYRRSRHRAPAAPAYRRTRRP